MFASRYSTFSFVGFALLAFSCADGDQVQKPMHIDAIDQGSEEELDEEEPTDEVDAGADDDAGSAEEADAGSAEEADAGSAEEADAGEEEEEHEKGMPCAVEQLLKTRCQGCHSAQAKSGVPLMTLENLMAPSKVDANVPTYARAAARMASTERPMPPMGKGTPVTPEELALFQAWVDDGAPADGCDP
jgi:hypothetical protein